jgi:hypothetical protein
MKTIMFNDGYFNILFVTKRITKRLLTLVEATF